MWGSDEDSARSKRILMIDDDSVVRMMLGRWISDR
jgi:hypothetical protein